MLGEPTTGRELSLAEMIRDPMVQQVMRSDGVTTEELLLVMQTAELKIADSSSRTIPTTLLRHENYHRSLSKGTPLGC